MLRLMTTKILGMTPAFLAAMGAFLIVAVFVGAALSQELPEGGIVYVTSGNCGVMADGTLFRNKEEEARSVPQPCSIWQDMKDPNIRYVFLADKSGEVVSILKLQVDTRTQTKLWTKNVDKSI